MYLNNIQPPSAGDALSPGHSACVVPYWLGRGSQEMLQPEQCGRSGGQRRSACHYHPTPPGPILQGSPLSKSVSLMTSTHSIRVIFSMYAGFEKTPQWEWPRQIAWPEGLWIDSDCEVALGLVPSWEKWYIVCWCLDHQWQSLLVEECSVIYDGLRLTQKIIGNRWSSVARPKVSNKLPLSIRGGLVSSVARTLDSWWGGPGFDCRWAAHSLVLGSMSV